MVLPPPLISSSISPTLLKSESTSNSKSADDFGCRCVKLLSTVFTTSLLVDWSGAPLGDGVRTSRRVGGISTTGDAGIDTPSFLLLGVVGEVEPEVSGDSDSSLAG